MEILNPTRLAKLGRKLYEERFKDAYAAEPLAIEVESKTAYLGKSVLEALTAAERAHQTAPSTS